MRLSSENRSQNPVRGSEECTPWTPLRANLGYMSKMYRLAYPRPT